MKRIIAIFLIALSLFAYIPIGAYAAEDKVEYVYVDLTKTSIHDDFPDLDLTQYVKNYELYNIYVVTLAEQYEEKNLFVYIYYPYAGNVVKNGKNKIQMKEGTQWKKYDLKYITDSNNIYKFKVMLPDAFFEKLNKNDRIYEISGIEIESTKNGLKEYKIGGTYKFRGFKENAKLVDVDTFEVVSLDVHFATLRNPADSVYEYNQLTSVYFSIPNSLLEKYNQKFHGIEVEYEKYQTKPILVTDSAALYGQLGEADTTVLPYYSDSKAGNHTGYYYSSNVANGVSAYYKETIYRLTMHDWHYNVPTSDLAYPFNDTIGSSGNGMQTIPIIIYTGKDITEKTFIESSVIVDKIEWFMSTSLGKSESYRTIKVSDYYLKQGITSPEADYYHSLLFYDQISVYTNSGAWDDVVFYNAGESPKVHKQITITDDDYNLICFGDTKSGWERFLYKVFTTGTLINDKTYTDIRPIQIINMQDVKGMKESTFAEAYAIDSHEVQALKNYATEEAAKNKTTYLFRIDFGKYEVYPIQTRYSVNGTKDGHGVMVSQPAYMGFDVIDIMFEDENGEIVSVPVVSTPKNFVGSIITPGGDGTKDELKWVWKALIALVGLVLLTYLYITYLHAPIKAVVVGVKKQTQMKKRTSSRGKKK